jgi:hypothetical protein
MSSSGGGYYRMHRGWMDGKMFASVKRDPFCKRAAWAWLIERAAFDGEGRGRLSFSVRYLAEAWGWPTTKVFGFLKACVQADMIECSTGTGQNVITLCNYNKYQAQSSSGGTQEGVRVERDPNTSRTNIKEGKKEEEDSEATASAALADPVKEMWQRGKALLGPKGASLLGKAIKEHSTIAVMEAIIATENEISPDPVAFFLGCLRSRANGRDRRSPVEKLYAGAMAAADELTRQQMAERSQSADGLVDYPPPLTLLDGGRSRG